MCKRNFCQFAAQKPRSGKHDPNAASEWCSLEDVASRLSLMNTEDRHDMDVTIGELVAAGGDLEDIESRICRLPNDLHPMFDRENICVCRHADKQYCYVPHMVAELEKAEGKLEGSIEPTWKHPLEHVMLRSAMQLASCILTHKDTLPFWACIFDHGDDPARNPDGLNRIHVRPHKHLDAASRKAVLDRLDQVTSRVRFHFKAFESGDYIHHAPEGPGLAGFMATPRADEEEATWENLPEGEMLYYAWKDGKPTVEIDDPIFTNIWVNVGHLKGLDSFDKSATISELRAAIIQVACTLVHELTHALVEMYVGGNLPYINDEEIIEHGCSLENFLFGGGLLVDDDNVASLAVVPWPNLGRWEQYSAAQGSCGLSKFGRNALPAAHHHIPEKRRWECFLEQDFWDEPEPRDGRLKKLWLRGDLITTEWEHYAQGRRPALGPAKKRVCLSETELARRRVCAIQDRGDDAMFDRLDRWDRAVDRLEERKAVFYEEGRGRALDAFWEGCTEHYDEKVFL